MRSLESLTDSCGQWNRVDLHSGHVGCSHWNQACTKSDCFKCSLRNPVDLARCTCVVDHCSDQLWDGFLGACECYQLLFFSLVWQLTSPSGKLVKPHFFVDLICSRFHAHAAQFTYSCSALLCNNFMPNDESARGMYCGVRYANSHPL